MEIAFAPKAPDEFSQKPIGRIVTISGSSARILLDKGLSDDENSDHDASPYMGTLLTVDTGFAVVLCLITSMTIPASSVDTGRTDPRIVEVELVGELVRETDGYLRTFRRGVSVYPRLGDQVQPASHDILQKAYHFGNFDTVEIGSIHQDQSIPAVIKVDEMLGKHFAIVGSTGTGKSCTVALILNRLLNQHPNAHIMLLDPHNEYGTCFGDKSEVVQLNNLSLPFWFLNFEEIVEILIGDAQKNAEEVELLRDLIPAAKQQFGSNRSMMLQKNTMRRERYSVDMPTPYRISDLLSLIDNQMGQLENKNGLGAYKRLRARIDTMNHDPRFAFMFGSLTINDNLTDELKRLFRIPVEGRPITVVQLMGLPSEIVNVVVSVLARLAFDVALWSEGKIPITFVCEEAHRYVPRDSEIGFEPTKRAISRIAKEGRKYGVSLCIVSQRPGHLDPTILSQCSTLFTMRLSNELDQTIVQSALSDASASLLDFLPALGTRETLVFGEGVALPSRVHLAELPADALPKGGTACFAEAWTEELADDGLLEDIVARWRMIGPSLEESATGGENPLPESAPGDVHAAGTEHAPAAQANIPPPGVQLPAQAVPATPTNSPQQNQAAPTPGVAAAPPAMNPTPQHPGSIEQGTQHVPTGQNTQMPPSGAPQPAQTVDAPSPPPAAPPRDPSSAGSLQRLREKINNLKN